MGRASGKSYEESLLSLADRLLPPTVVVSRRCTAFITSAALMTTARLGIADLLKDGPQTVKQLAAELGINQAEALYSMLRCLVNEGISEALPGSDGQPTLFRNNKYSACMREDHPNCVRHLAIHWHGEAYPAFNDRLLDHHLFSQPEVNSGCPFEEHFGMTVWEHLQQHPAKEANFSKAMKDVDCLAIKGPVADYPWAGFRRVVDVGGAHGSALAAILEAHPKPDGLLFDQPQVVKAAVMVWESTAALQPMAKRVEFVGGDFFEPGMLPSGQDGDVFWLRLILHDWSDERAIAILRSVRTAIGTADVTLALGETSLIPEFGGNPVPRIGFCIDLLMMAVHCGKERTLDQWKQLFAASGFAYSRHLETRGPIFIIEAKPT